jgi:sugar phosphate isomerase/epimerase
VTELGIFARTFARPDLAATLDAVRDCGVRTMQFNLALAEGVPAGAIRRECEARGLRMAAVSGTCNMAHPDPAVRDEGLRWLRTVIAAAGELGTGVVTLCTGTRDPEDMWRRHPDNGTPEAWADMLASVAAAVETAEEHGVTLAFEPEHANVVDSVERARRLLDEVRSPRLRVAIDPANLPGEPLERAFALLAEEIVIAHAKDRRSDGTFAAAGQGDVDWDTYLRLLAPLAVPLIMHGLAEEEVEAAVAFLRAHLERA